MRSLSDKILVTGGAGFVGSEFVRQAVTQSRQMREWLHVRDCAEAIDLVLQKGKSGEVEPSNSLRLPCGRK